MAKLYFYYASMNAGKSTNLLQADFNYRERGMQTMRWTAAIDTRDAAPFSGASGGTLRTEAPPPPPSPPVVPPPVEPAPPPPVSPPAGGGGGLFDPNVSIP